MDCVKIGQFIAKRRRELGYTQNAVAERLGISDKAVPYKSEIVLQRHRSGMLYYIISLRCLLIILSFRLLSRLRCIRNRHICAKKKSF